MSLLPLFGLLRHRIIILENTNQADLGQELWQERYSTFAQIKPIYDSKVGSLENFDFGHVVTEGYFMFKIRALPDLNSKMRISFKNRLFDIKRIIDIDERGRLFKIIASEI
jgi:head-tail adaptor